MLGVRRSHAGLGLARRLLDALHERSYRDRESCGVTLNTEDPSNVPLYQHFGYRVIGQGRVSDELHMWAFYRGDRQVTSRDSRQQDLRLTRPMIIDRLGRGSCDCSQVDVDLRDRLSANYRKSGRFLEFWPDLGDLRPLCVAQIEPSWYNRHRAF